MLLKSDNKNDGNTCFFVVSTLPTAFICSSNTTIVMNTAVKWKCMQREEMCTFMQSINFFNIFYKNNSYYSGTAPKEATHFCNNTYPK